MKSHHPSEGHSTDSFYFCSRLTKTKQPMDKLSYYTHTFVFSLAGLLVLCTVLVNVPELPSGAVTGKQCWFHGAMLFVTFPLAATAFIKRGKMRYTVSFADLLVLLSVINLLAFYNWEADPAPDKLLFWLQAGVLWFSLRILTMHFPFTKKLFSGCLIALGCIEAIWGIGQLYGWWASNHSLYRLTGSFYNPGPFSGFLAVIFPLALYEMLNRKTASSLLQKSFCYFSGFTALLILSVLPAAGSRTAWLSVGIAATWMLWRRYNGTGRLRRQWAERKAAVAGGFLLCIFAFILAGIALFSFKEDSARGRLFMWRITARAIGENPFKGDGLGSFAGTYATAQAGYFETGKGSETEKKIAGSPEYAFNEYLQVWKEEGASGLFLFVALLGTGFYQARKNNRTGTGGAILSFALFAFASYPLQLPGFCILLIFLLVLSGTTMQLYSDNVFTDPLISEDGGETHAKGKISNTILILKGQSPLFYFSRIAGRYFFIALLCVGCWWIWGKQKDRYSCLHQWNTLKMLHRNQAYREALPGYAALYSRFHAYPAFLFEYAGCLSGCGQYEQAVRILKRASLLSADPMICNMIARNCHDSRRYADAEKWLLRSTWLVPHRIYPYYLLTRLYSEPAFYNPAKMQQAAGVVLYRSPKIESPAIAEMREEVRRLTGK